MNTQALGGFLRGAREARGESPSEVVVALKRILGRNVDPTTIWKIESARMMPSSELLLALLQVLGLNSADAWAILRRADLSVHDGEERGRRAAQGTTLTDEDIAILASLPDDKRARLEVLLAERRAELGD